MSETVKYTTKLNALDYFPLNMKKKFEDSKGWTLRKSIRQKKKNRLEKIQLKFNFNSIVHFSTSVGKILHTRSDKLNKTYNEPTGTQRNLTKWSKPKTLISKKLTLLDSNNIGSRKYVSLYLKKTFHP